MKSKKIILSSILLSLIFLICISSVAANENITEISSDDNQEIISSSYNQTEDQLLSDGETNDDIEIKANSATYDYSNNYVEYSFKVYNSTTNNPINGATYYFDGNSEEPPIEGYSNSNGVCIVKFKPSYISDNDAIINVYYGNSQASKIVKIIINPQQKSTNTDSTNTKNSVSPIKTNVKAPVITVKYKAKKYFKITVKNSKGKIIKNLKLKVKVWTGKKVKTYTLKTDKKGIAKLSTKKLKAGVHKVVITSKNSKYKISKSSKIIVQPVKFKIGKYTGTFTLKQLKNIKKAKNYGYSKTITIKTGKYVKGKYRVKMSLSSYTVDGRDLGKNKYSLEVWSSYGPIGGKTITIY